MRKFKINVICMAFYNTEMEVPDNLSKKEAIEYVRNHIDELSVSDLNWISDIDIDDDNCDFAE